MWFYIYLLTTPFYEEIGFHMWGKTTHIDFSDNKYYSFYNETLYYSGIYKIPVKFVAYPFERVITFPLHRLVRDEFGLEWYKMSPQTIKDICLNASIPFLEIGLQVKEDL